MPLTPELLDELLKDYTSPEELLGEDGLLQQLTKALLERALHGELTHHLGYERHDPSGRKSGNSRNGQTRKHLQGEFGQIELATPRDRNGTFEPQIVAKRQTRLAGLDDKILGLYAGGMTVRDISFHLSELYGTEIGRDTISRITDAVLEDVQAWRTRPLERVYPIVYFDAMFVKVREDRSVKNLACYLALGVDCDGEREVLGIWWQETEGAKFWLAVLNDLRRRGVEDVLIACVDGLKGFPEAIEAVFPQTQVQLCLVHLVRHSLSYVSHKDRKAVADGLKEVYQAATVEEAERQLTRFEEAWAASYPVIARSWRQNWSRVIPMFSYPAEIRRAVYTTNTIESLNMTLRKVSKNRALFPNDEAVFKLLYLALRNISQRWTMPIPNWSGAMNQFAILFDGRVPMGGLNQNSLTQTA